jgi:hypothetical protein
LDVNKIVRSLKPELGIRKEEIEKRKRETLVASGAAEGGETTDEHE